MKVGDKVRHKLSGQEMVIYKLSECGKVATTEIENEPLERDIKWNWHKPRAVCLTENLELIDKQLNLF